MTAPDPATSADPLFLKVGEASMRMFSSSVPPKTTSELHKIVEQSGGDEQGYPWEAVADRVLADPLPQEELVRRSLRAQRDWLAVGAGARKPGVGARVSQASKGFVARSIGRLVTFVVWTVLVVLVLFLVRIRFPDADVYWLLEAIPEDFRLQLRKLMGGG